MKINHVIVGMLIVLAFLAGRWYPAKPSASPANPAIAGVGLQTQPPPTIKERSTQLQSAPKNPSLPLSGKPTVVYPSLPELPVTQGKPEVVRNTGLFIDPDPRKLAMPYMGPDRPTRNTGEFIDPGLPTTSPNR